MSRILLATFAVVLVAPASSWGGTNRGIKDMQRLCERIRAAEIHEPFAIRRARTATTCYLCSRSGELIPLVSESGARANGECATAAQRIYGLDTRMAQLARGVGSALRGGDYARAARLCRTGARVDEVAKAKWASFTSRCEGVVEAVKAALASPVPGRESPGRFLSACSSGSGR
jgi:hypothetical protein